MRSDQVHLEHRYEMPLPGRVSPCFSGHHYQHRAGSHGFLSSNPKGDKVEHVTQEQARHHARHAGRAVRHRLQHC